jgi:PilZ domain
MLAAAETVTTALLEDMPDLGQRAFPRYRYRPAHPVRVTAPGVEAAPRLASLHDLSANGVGLLVERPVTPGMVLVLEVLTWGGAILRLVARVAHASPWTADRWLIGCALYRPLAARELESLA